MNMKGIKGFGILTICLALFLGGCKAGKEATPSTTQELPTLSPKPMIKGGEDSVKAVPNATIFKMNGDYADNVAITLNNDGSLAYYPDPTDISSYSRPYPLGGGWYLNRQGISPESRFTTYTFEQYKALGKLPSHNQLIDAVIPGAEVTEFMEIPISVSEALANPEACKQYIPK